MKELFDDVASRSRRDPLEVARESSAPPKRKRFYKDVSVAEGEGGFTVALDGKPIRTPSQAIVVFPVRTLADIAAAEWGAQQEFIDPLSMPLTRLANSIVQGVASREQLVADDIAKFFGSDLLFYRAEFPDELIANQAKHWDPVLRWAADDLGAHFILAQGIMPVSQPEQAIARVRKRLPSDAWRIGALHVVTTVTGSALLALALHMATCDADAVWAAAHVDEDWNAERWGADEEVTARRAVRRRDFDAAVKVIEALRG